MLECPHCGKPLAAPGGSHAIGNQPWTAYRECPSCEKPVTFRRQQDSDEWRVYPGDDENPRK